MDFDAGAVIAGVVALEAGFGVVRCFGAVAFDGGVVFDGFRGVDIEQADDGLGAVGELDFEGVAVADVGDSGHLDKLGERVGRLEIGDWRLGDWCAPADGDVDADGAGEAVHGDGGDLVDFAVDGGVDPGVGEIGGGGAGGCGCG